MSRFLPTTVLEPTYGVAILHCSGVCVTTWSGCSRIPTGHRGAPVGHHSVCRSASGGSWGPVGRRHPSTAACGYFGYCGGLAFPCPECAVSRCQTPPAKPGLHQPSQVWSQRGSIALPWSAESLPFATLIPRKMNESTIQEKLKNIQHYFRLCGYFVGC